MKTIILTDSQWTYLERVSSQAGKEYRQQSLWLWQNSPYDLAGFYQAIVPYRQ